MAIPGQHNIYNATAAFTAAREVTEVDKSAAIKELNTFKGTGRRFEQFLSSGGVIIIDDYAHHPTAIRATIKAAREKFGPDKRILCIFQPHQHSRTIKLLKKFTSCFNGADEVIIPNIYKVRDTEEDAKNMSAEKFVEALSHHHSNIHYGHGLEKTIEDVQNRFNDFDIILVMGAGDVIKVSDALKSSSK